MICLSEPETDQCGTIWYTLVTAGQSYGAAERNRDLMIYLKVVICTALVTDALFTCFSAHDIPIFRHLW